MGAPLAAVPGVVKILLRGFIDNLALNVWSNVLHAKYTGGPPSNADCAAIATAIAAQWASHMAPECPSQTSLQEVQVTDLSSATSGQGSWLGTDTGSRGDDAIPANAAVLITYVSGLRYKGGHPRTYLYAGGNADLQGAAEWSTAFRAEVQTHWNAFLTAVEAITQGSTSLGSAGFVRYRGKYLPNGGPPHYYLTTPLFEVFPAGGGTAALEMASQKGRIGRREA